MSWMIGRAAAMSNPEAARAKALAKLQGLAELDDPESVVVPILIDALLMVGMRMNPTITSNGTNTIATGPTRRCSASLPVAVSHV